MTQDGDGIMDIRTFLLRFQIFVLKCHRIKICSMVCRLCSIKQATLCEVCHSLLAKLAADILQTAFCLIGHEYEFFFFSFISPVEKKTITGQSLLPMEVR